MPDKISVAHHGVKDARTPMEIAEERIAKYKRNPEKPENYEFEKKHISIGFAPTLNLKGLGLKTIPESLRTIRNISVLDISKNNIQELPSWIGEFSELGFIDLSENQLRELPPEISLMEHLIVLCLENNQLRSLPETLRSWYHPHKKPRLDYLGLAGNPDLGLPDSIICRPPEEILRYYFESRDEMGRPLLELKLLLVGRGKAGKTTLVKQLAGEKPDENESETHSIAIRELTLGCSHGQVRTRAWDFGGQEILHSTHQFFLTERKSLPACAGTAHRSCTTGCRVLAQAHRDARRRFASDYSNERESWPSLARG